VRTPAGVRPEGADFTGACQPAAKEVSPPGRPKVKRGPSGAGSYTQ